jgi:DNA-directed RNA polymerase specialized sigma24 family protein
MSEQANNPVVDLQWVAYLLTGDHAFKIDLALEELDLDARGGRFFSNWLVAWSRRIAISKTLAAVRDELAASVRRTASQSAGRTAPTPGDWPTACAATKPQFERALLAIDVFPRTALVLSDLEKLSNEDAAVLLGCDRDLVRKGRMLGLRELGSNLARMQRERFPVLDCTALSSQWQHA